MKKCKAKFGEIGPDGKPTGDDSAAPAAPPNTPATAPAKRARSTTKAIGSTKGKKTRSIQATDDAAADDDGPEREDDDVQEETPTKKAKVAAPIGGEVKVKDEHKEAGETEA
jgi:hypothetical protein